MCHQVLCSLSEMDLLDVAKFEMASDIAKYSRYIYYYTRYIYLYTRYINLCSASITRHLSTV